VGVTTTPTFLGLKIGPLATLKWSFIGGGEGVQTGTQWALGSTGTSRQTSRGIGLVNINIYCLRHVANEWMGEGVPLILYLKIRVCFSLTLS
jgi:hypothetical protein